MEIQWNKYKEEKPPTSGKYLHCANRWMRSSVGGGNYVLHQSMVVAAYDTEGQNGNWRGEAHGHLVEPDEWAHLPFPEAPPKPTEEVSPYCLDVELARVSSSYVDDDLLGEANFPQSVAQPRKRDG